MYNKKFIVFLFLAIILVSAIVRLVIFEFFTKDSVEVFEYNRIAENMLAGQGYSFEHLGSEYKTFAAPLYPFLIFSIYKLIGPNPDYVIYAQIILSLLASTVIFFIAMRIADYGTSLMALALSAFHPALIVYSVKKIHALPLDIFLYTLVILFIIKLKEDASIKNAVLAGLAASIAALARPSILIFLPFALLWFFWACGKRFAAKAVTATLMILLTAMPVSGWIIRNYRVHKQFILSSTCDAEVFWRGNNPNATGASYGEDGVTVLETDRELYNKIKTLSELEKRTFFGEKSTEFIRNNPGKFARLFFRKLYYFWWFSPVSGFMYPSYYLMAYKLFYVLVLFTAVSGIIFLLYKRDKTNAKNVILLLLFLLSISIFQSIYYVEGRHRWLVEPVLLIFSASGISFLVTKSKSALWRN